MILGFSKPAKFFKEPFNLPRPEPADDGGGNFIGDHIAEDRRMSRASPDFRAHKFLDLTRHFRVIKKAGALLHLQPHHDAESSLFRQIQKPAGRDIVSSNGIQAVGGNGRKVLLDNSRLGIGDAVRVGVKRPVRHTANVEFLLANPQEFPAHRGAEACG